VTVPGVRVRTADGKLYEGVPVAGAPTGELRLKTAEGTFVLAARDVASREPLAIDLRRVYTPRESLCLLGGRAPGLEPEALDRAGADLLRVKLRDRAWAAFRTAELLRHPEWPEARLAAELAKLRDRLESLALRKAVYQVRESCLAGDYDAALSEIGAVEPAVEGDLRAEVRRLRAELETLRGQARDERVVREWVGASEAFLKMKAMDRGVSWSAARAYVEGPVRRDVVEEVRRRLNFSPEDPAVEILWERRPAEAIAKHAYDEATWPAVRPDLGSPEAWWSAAPDLSRYKLLKGLFVERHLAVLETLEKTCPSCGGSGLEGGAVCGSCAGLKVCRVVVYR
jgi:hypothetical protein